MISNHKSHCAAQPPITCAVCSLTLKNTLCSEWSEA
jgi:hypothetical protein